MEANSFISGRRGVALPFTDECDPLAADAEKFDILWQAAVGRAASRKWKYLELRGGSTSIPTARTAAEFFGHEVAVEGQTPIELFANCTSAARRAVRKAEKCGVLVEFSR